jgi:hypothetical protein
VRTRSPTCEVERAGPAVERRRDLRVLQIEPRLIGLRLVGGQRRFERGRRGDVRLVLRTRQNPSAEEIFGTTALGCGVAQLGIVFGDDRIGLTHRCFERTAIEHEERLTLADVCPVKRGLLSCPVICARMSTVEIASAVPTASSVTGIGFTSAAAVTTGIAADDFHLA